MSPSVHIVLVTPERWPDLRRLFGANGACGGCWCMWWKLPRRDFVRGKRAGKTASGRVRLYRASVDVSQGRVHRSGAPFAVAADHEARAPLTRRSLAQQGEPRVRPYDTAAGRT